MDQRKKAAVVFVTTSFGRGENGPETYANYLWDGFRNDPAFEFHIVAPTFPCSHTRFHTSGAGGNSWAFYRRLGRKAVQVARSLSGAPVLLHVNHCHLDTTVLDAGCRVVGQINDYENAELDRRWHRIILQQGVRRGLALWFRRRRERRFVRTQDLTICNSNYTRAAVLRAYEPPRPGNVVTIYKAVDLAAYRPPEVLPPDPLNRNRDRLQLVFVGTDFIRKGLDVLMRAMPRLVGEAELTVVGPTEAQVRNATLDSDLPARYGSALHFAGRLDKEALRHILWHSDALVLPSRAEALGVVLLEAAAAGLHVIGTRVGGIPEILGHLPDSQLISSDSVDELVTAIGAVRDIRAGAVASCYAGVELFSKQHMLEKVRAAYLQQLFLSS